MVGPGLNWGSWLHGYGHRHLHHFLMWTSGAHSDISRGKQLKTGPGLPFHPYCYGGAPCRNSGAARAVGPDNVTEISSLEIYLSLCLSTLTATPQSSPLSTLPGGRAADLSPREAPMRRCT